MSGVNPMAELIAAHQIRQLACKFALAHDSRDMEAFEHLFVPAEEPLPFPRFNLVNVLQTLPGGCPRAGASSTAPAAPDPADHYAPPPA